MRLAGSSAGRWASAVLGAFAAAAGGMRAGALPPKAILVAGSLALAALALYVALRRRPAVTAPVLLLLVATLGGALRGWAAAAATGPGRVDAALSPTPVVLVGTVRSAADSRNMVVDAERVLGDDADRRASGGVLVTAQSLPALLPGDRVEVDASNLKAPGARPGPDSEAALEREDVQAIAASAQVLLLQHGGLTPARAIAVLQSRLTETIDESLPEPAAALLLGIAFGLRRPLPADVRADLQDAGLIHVVVVSGLKVVILIGLVAVVARRRQWSRARTLAVSAPTVVGYVLLSGSGPAAIRSALMAGAGMAAGTAGRRTDPLPMLALAAAVMVGAQPEVVKDVGFQLSFLGTLGILVLASPLAARIPGPRLFAEPFAVTVAAQLATLPVMAGTFGVIALGGPLANAVILPLLPLLILVGGGSALLSTVAPALAWIPLHAAALGAGFVAVVGRLVSAVPGSAIQVGSWPPAWTLAELTGLAAAGLLWLGLRRHLPGTLAGPRLGALVAAGGAGVALISGVVASGPDGRLHVTVLDTGSSPAVLIRTADGGTVLVDGGSSPALLVQALGRILPPAASRLDQVVVTGGEQQAVEGLAGLAGRYSIGTVIAPVEVTPGAAAVLTGLQQRGADLVRGGGRWRWGGASWACLAYRSATSGRDMCALTAADDGVRLLVLGDAGADDQEELAAQYGPQVRCDLLVAEPGGATSALLLGAAEPRFLAVPLARGSLPSQGLTSLPAASTGVDGDLSYSTREYGLMERS
jgi:ComEC/Rec2-related protein